MRSGTSYFDKTLCKKNISRFWPLWAGWSLVWLFTVPLRALTEWRSGAHIGNPDYYTEYGSAWRLAIFSENLAEDMVAISLFVAVCFGVVVAMAMFSHLYFVRSANFVGGLPVTRDGVFVTNYLTGLGFLLLPLLVVFLLTLVIEALAGCLFLEVLLAWLAIAAGESFFFYSFAVLVGQIAGHILAVPAFYGIFNGLAFGLYALMELLLSQLYYGYDGMSAGLTSAAMWLTPVYTFAEEVRPRWQSNGVFSLDGGGALAAYAVVAAVMAAVAWLAYRRRALESAGDVVAVDWLKPVFKYSVSFCAGLAFGMVTQGILGLGIPGLLLCVALWAVVGCFVAQMFLDKSFKVLKKWRGPAVMGALMLALCVGLLMDFTGYERRVPDPSQVAEVFVSRINSYPSDSGSWGSVTSEDPTLIADVVALHQAVVDDRDNINREHDDTTGFYVTYYMKNGGILSREYGGLSLIERDLHTPGTVTCELNDLIQNEVYLVECYGLDNPTLYELLNANSAYYMNYSGTVQGVHGSGDSDDNTLIRELVLAILEDVELGLAGKRTVFYQELEEAVQVSIDITGMVKREGARDSDSSQPVTSMVNPGGATVYYEPSQVEVTEEGSVHIGLYLTITPEAVNSWPVFLEIYDKGWVEYE